MNRRGVLVDGGVWGADKLLLQLKNSAATYMSNMNYFFSEIFLPMKKCTHLFSKMGKLNSEMSS